MRRRCRCPALGIDDAGDGAVVETVDLGAREQRRRGLGLADELVDRRGGRTGRDVVGLDRDLERVDLGRERLLVAVVDLDDLEVLRQVLRPGLRRRSCRARDRQRDQEPAGEDDRERPAGASTPETTAPQNRDSPSARRVLRVNGIRPFSTRSPSQARTAGRTTRLAIIATTTTLTVATANEMNVASPVMNIPDMAMITVRPGDQHGAARCGRGSRDRVP